jgi:hypothetical protein
MPIVRHRNAREGSGLTTKLGYELRRMRRKCAGQSEALPGLCDTETQQGEQVISSSALVRVRRTRNSRQRRRGAQKGNVLLRCQRGNDPMRILRDMGRAQQDLELPARPKGQAL